MKKLNSEYKSNYYHSFDKRYETIKVIPLELVPKHFLSMAEWAQKYSISTQRCFQLWRQGFLRGIKAKDPFYNRIRIFIDPNIPPPKLRSWSRKRSRLETP